MTFWQMIGLFVTGGVLGSILTSIGSIVTTLMINRGEEKRAIKRREEEIADRNFSLKKEAYAGVFKDAYHSGFHRQIGKVKQLTEEESRARNDTLMVFEMFASKSVREKMTPLAGLLGKEIPSEENAREMFFADINKAILNLRNAMQEDLGIS